MWSTYPTIQTLPRSFALDLMCWKPCDHDAWVMNVLDQMDYDVIRLNIAREELTGIDLAFKESSTSLFYFFITCRAVLTYLLFSLSPCIETLRLLKPLFPILQIQPISLNNLWIYPSPSGENSVYSLLSSVQTLGSDSEHKVNQTLSGLIFWTRFQYKRWIIVSSY